MKLDERERIPPPPRCLTCEYCAEYQGANADLTQLEKRHYCLKLKPMHPDCAWHTPRGTT